MAKVDEEQDRTPFSLDFRGLAVPVVTTISFTKFGQTLIVAEARVKGSSVCRGEGGSREEAVAALRKVVREVEQQPEREAVFCCVTCGSRFVKERPFTLHQLSGVCGN